MISNSNSRVWISRLRKKHLFQNPVRVLSRSQLLNIIENLLCLTFFFAHVVAFISRSSIMERFRASRLRRGTYGVSKMDSTDQYMLDVWYPGTGLLSTRGWIRQFANSLYKLALIPDMESTLWSTTWWRKNDHHRRWLEYKDQCWLRQYLWK